MDEFKGTVGIYVRVSTLEQAQEGYSIAAQKERLKSYCKAQGWNDFRFYVDEGISGKDTNRPQLKQMLEHVKEGKINLILVYRLDRFTRSVRDLHKMLEVMDKHKCGFRSATEVYDTTSAMGRLFITIVAALAEWESANSSERIKMMLEKKVADGERVGNVPYGFSLNKDEVLEINEDESVVILGMIDKLKSGLNPSAIARALKTAGNNDRAWTATSTFRILRNPAICGDTRWNDDVYENTHKGIVTKEEFDYIQGLLNDRTTIRRPDVNVNYIFQGVLKCPNCNATHTVNRYLRTLPNGTKHQSSVYRCGVCAKNKKATTTPGEERFVAALYIYMENYEIEKGKIKEVPLDNEYDRLKKQLKKIENIRAKYQRGWADNKIADEEFSKLMDETLPQYENAKKELAAYKDPVSISEEDIKRTVLFFNENFKELSNGEQRAFVSEFIKEIHYELVPQPPKHPRNKKGRPALIITNIVFR